MIGAVDASFAMDTMTRKSHGGFINFVNNVSNSHKQMRGNLDVHKAAQAVVIVLERGLFQWRENRCS